MGDEEREGASPFARLEYEEWRRHSAPSLFVARIARRSLTAALVLIITVLAALALVYALLLLP
jgi:hypothetical protein